MHAEAAGFAQKCYFLSILANKKIIAATAKVRIQIRNIKTERVDLQTARN